MNIDCEIPTDWEGPADSVNGEISVRSAKNSDDRPSLLLDKVVDGEMGAAEGSWRVEHTNRVIVCLTQVAKVVPFPPLIIFTTNNMLVYLLFGVEVEFEGISVVTERVYISQNWITVSIYSC